MHPALPVNRPEGHFSAAIILMRAKNPNFYSQHFAENEGKLADEGMGNRNPHQIREEADFSF
jgi:hypothetical protein